MRIRILLAVILLPAAAAGQDAPSILETMQERQVARWDGVENYIVDQATMGHRTLLYYERVELQSPNGTALPGFRMVPPDEIARRQQEEDGFALSAKDLRRLSDAAAMTGDALGGETERAMSEAGFPPGLLSASPNRFATLDLRVMMGNVSDFYDAAADAQEASEARDPAADSRQSLADMAEFAAMAELVGTEDVYDRKAWVIRADDIGRTQRTDDGQEMTIDTATFWIDTEEYVPLRLKMDGVLTSGGESRPLTIEKHDQDYRRVGSLFMPYRQVMRIAGIMDAKQRAEMQEAQEQLAEFEKQMASMPESQRQMMENMMGPQIEMVRKMAAGGGLEVVTDVYQVRVNAGLPDEQAQGEVLFRAMPPTAGPEGSRAGNSTTDTGNAGRDGAAPGGRGMSSGNNAPPQPVSSPSAPDEPADEAALQAAQQECLQEKIEEAQAAQKKRRGFGRLLGAVNRVASRRGNFELTERVEDLYAADATVADLAAAAEDLGLTEEDVAECRNPL